MISTFYYKKGSPFETNLSRERMVSVLMEQDGLLWLDLESPNDFEEDALVEIFNFHALAIEDCLNDRSHPKVDNYEDYLFIVMHGLVVQLAENEKIPKLVTQELNIFLGKNYIVTFHKVPVKAVEQVRDVINRKPEIHMSHGADLLLHSILDHLVDNYLPVLDQYDEVIDKLEEDVFDNPSKNYLSMVMQIKRDLFSLRRTMSPQRDILNAFTHSGYQLIKPKHLIYFKDVYDHLFKIYGSIEAMHETITGLLQAYFSYSSNRLNEIMKRMTVLATLTMPSVIIASIYGMNFHNIPGLEWSYGYHTSLILMGVISIIMLIWMKWKKWI